MIGVFISQEYGTFMLTSLRINFIIDRSVNKKEKCTGRAVFTVTQKNWLEYYFQMEKYITKQNRKILASSLGLTDLQVS